MSDENEMNTDLDVIAKCTDIARETVTIIETEDTTAEVDIDIPDIGRPLTRCERALFFVLCDPGQFGTVGRERAEAAHISLRSYWDIMNKADYQNLISVAYRRAVQQAMGPVLRAAIDTASMVGRDGAPDRSVLMQVAGVFTPRQHVDINPAPRQIVGVVGVSLDDL